MCCAVGLLLQTQQVHARIGGWLYSVGTQNYGYKMRIFHDDLDRNVPGGLQVDYKGDDGGPYSYGYAMYGGMSASAGTPGPGTMTGYVGM
ncbi:MAG: hypothetical protein IPF64_17840 [Flavobacteriales bacterium]|nr:hypothetical protein [Flavobacteriales bacterium]